MDYAYQALAAAGFGIVEEEYRCTADGQIAQGIYRLNFNQDPELSMMFAWTNSYNKQVKFKCVVGAYINQSGSVMISGDIGSWVRKHTGTADTEVKDTIDQYISNAHMYYNQLCADKASMEGVSLNKRRQAQLLGVLFAEYEILTTEQASMIRDQMKKPQQVFANTDSLWAFYNFVTNSLQHSHPKTWMEDQRILHYFIGTICNFAPATAPVVQVPDNQVVQEEVETESVLHQYEEEVEDVVEDTEVSFDIDADDDAVLDSLLIPIEKTDTHEDVYAEISVEEDLLPPGLLDEAILKYTDPAGNTFEAPVVPEPDPEDDEDIPQMPAPEPENDAFDYRVDDFSLSASPADYEMLEATESSVGIPAIADLDSIPVEKKESSVDFELDLSNDEETEDDGSSIPDFF
jgi:hypothetical protein